MKPVKSDCKYFRHMNNDRLPGRPALVSLDILLRNIARYLLNPYLRWMIVRVVFSGQLKRYFESSNVIKNAGSVSKEGCESNLTAQGCGLRDIVTAVVDKSLRA